MEKKCRYCAMMIPKEAKVCPYCRKTLGWTWPAKIALILFVLGLIGALAGKSGQEIAQKPAAKPAAQIIAVSAEQLYKDYDANEVAADLKYKNRILRVAGTIRDLGKTMDRPYLNLATGAFSHQVMVLFPAGRYDAQLATYKKGAGVEVTGRCTGRTLGMVGISMD